MKQTRIISRLDVKNDALVKGIHLEGLRVLGHPESFAKKYYEEGIDELVVVDVVASLYGRNSLYDMVEKITSFIFVPITVGGGVRSVEDARKLLLSGADKVAVNTAAVQRPELLREISREFGHSTLTLMVEAEADSKGRYLVYTDNGRERTDLDVFDWIEKAQVLGVGEVIVTSIDRDGTGRGPDLELAEKAATLTDVPFIYQGGLSSVTDCAALAEVPAVDGVCASSLFHYHYQQQMPKEVNVKGNKKYLEDVNEDTHTLGVSIPDLRKGLKEKALTVRQAW